jgi:hypothetical protein
MIYVTIKVTILKYIDGCIFFLFFFFLYFNSVFLSVLYKGFYGSTSASTSSFGLALPDFTFSRRFASADGAMRSRVDVGDWRGKTGYAYIF